MAGSIMGNLPEEGEADESQDAAAAQARSQGLSGVAEEDDEDRIDARNAASRLATSTF